MACGCWISSSPPTTRADAERPVTRPSLVLVHSPLVGPMTWRGVADRLRGLGYRRVETPEAHAWAAQPDYYRALAARVAERLDGEPWVLVGHSGAGGLLPSVAATLGGRARAMVFVDAILPHPGRSWFETTPPALAGMLRERARDGAAPAWPDWFPHQVLEGLLPDAAVRAAFAAEAKPIPMAFLDEPAPITADPPAGACAYLRLSAGYDAEANAAAAAGWTVARERFHHLAMVSEPDRVAAALHSLIETLSSAVAKDRP
jgi:pimeloyl-ACP methyl ester carboxylesterase